MWIPIFTQDQIEAAQAQTYNLNTPQGCSIVIYNQSPYTVHVTTSTGQKVDEVPGHTTVTMPYENTQSLVFQLDPTISDGLTFDVQYVAARLVKGTVTYQRASNYPQATNVANQLEAIIQNQIQALITNQELPVTTGQSGLTTSISGTVQSEVTNTVQSQITNTEIPVTTGQSGLASTILNETLSTTEAVTIPAVEVTLEGGQPFGSPCATVTLQVPPGMYDSFLILITSALGQDFLINSFFNAYLQGVQIASYDINADNGGNANSVWILCTNTKTLPTDMVQFDLTTAGVSQAETVLLQAFAFRSTYGSQTQPQPVLQEAWDPNTLEYRQKTLGYSFPLESGTFNTTQPATYQDPVAYGHRGVMILLNITNVSGTSNYGLLPRISWTDAYGISFVIASAQNYVNTAGYYVYLFHPEVPEQPSTTQHGHLTESHPCYLPPGYRIIIYHGDSASYTYSASAVTLP
ncbi:hypothetical protein [Alicyclobacillus shizuokensis]|uniref:hypothetical protein n=1 Tax=Alicyclobacillus shizuokensis TaxID=392014 RepID=UPI0008359180|nr:hypothetical protein [Alicyclobacillus shizuokensis]